MNWTGGNLQRHSKTRGNAVVERQKAYFAKARNKVPKSRASTQDWEDAFPSQPTPLAATKKIRPRHKRSPRIQAWSISGRKDGKFLEDFKLPSQNGDVQVRVGRRAFASQLDTTVASPSTKVSSLSRSNSNDSSDLMLFDNFDQPDVGTRVSVDHISRKLRDDGGHSSPVSRHMEQTCCPQVDHYSKVKQHQDDASGSVAHALPGLQSDAACSGNASNITPADYTQSLPKAAVPSEGSPVESHSKQSRTSEIRADGNPASLDHEHCEDNDDTWQRFIQEEIVKVGQTKNDVYAAPQYTQQASRYSLAAWEETPEEPLYPTGIRDSTPHSSCPTAHACLLETGPSKRTGGETMERETSNDERMWRSFVLGSDFTGAS